VLDLFCTCKRCAMALSSASCCARLASSSFVVLPG
jgi:hypothetical protein